MLECQGSRMPPSAADFQGNRRRPRRPPVCGALCARVVTAERSPRALRACRGGRQAVYRHHLLADRHSGTPAHSLASPRTRSPRAPPNTAASAAKTVQVAAEAAALTVARVAAHHGRRCRWSATISRAASLTRGITPRPTVAITAAHEGGPPSIAGIRKTEKEGRVNQSAQIAFRARRGGRIRGSLWKSIGGSIGGSILGEEGGAAFCRRQETRGRRGGAAPLKRRSTPTRGHHGQRRWYATGGGTTVRCRAIGSSPGTVIDISVERTIAGTSDIADIHHFCR